MINTHTINVHLTLCDSLYVYSKLGAPLGLYILFMNIHSIYVSI